VLLEEESATEHMATNPQSKLSQTRMGLGDQSTTKEERVNRPRIAGR